jgi:hypothetical protein
LGDYLVKDTRESVGVAKGASEIGRARQPGSRQNL